MQILNDIACNLNSNLIQFNLDLIKSNWIQIHWMKFEFKFNNWIKIFKIFKWDTNWWRRYQKSACKYDVGE